MPKGKGKGRRGAGETKAERALRRAIARELPAIKAVAECCDGFRDEWRRAKVLDEFMRSIGDRTDEEAVELWERVVMGRDGVEMLLLGIELGSGCESLVALPDAIGDFASLTLLVLKGCKNLLALPNTIGGLGALTTLVLSGCTRLAALPDSIGELKTLTTLDLSGCSSLAELPDAIGGLEALTTLKLLKCSSLAALPDAIGELGALKILIVSVCTSLTALPESLGKLRALRRLHLSGTSLSVLPECVGGLKLLRTLRLNDCASLTALPPAIVGLSSLEQLFLRGCPGLVKLPEGANWKALEIIDVSKCSSLMALPPGLGLCKRLTTIDARGSGLVSIHLWGTGALRTLKLSGCESLIALDSKLDTKDDLTITGADDVPRYDSEDRIWLRLYRRRCDGCARQFAPDAPRLRVCGACRDFSYCSVECQRAHWDHHRVSCRRRQRRCVVCTSRVLDTDPPLPTCHCGKRRYCGEECQAKDWAAGHAQKCASGYLYLEEGS